MRIGKASWPILIWLVKSRGLLLLPFARYRHTLHEGLREKRGDDGKKLPAQRRHGARIHAAGAHDLPGDDVGRILAEHEGAGMDLDPVRREAPIDPLARPFADELDQSARDGAEVVVPSSPGADGHAELADDLLELSLDVDDLVHRAQVQVMSFAEARLVARANECLEDALVGDEVPQGIAEGVVRPPRLQLLTGREEEGRVHGEERGRDDDLRDHRGIRADGFHDHAGVLGQDREEAHHAPRLREVALLVQSIEKGQGLHCRADAVLAGGERKSNDSKSRIPSSAMRSTTSERSVRRISSMVYMGRAS